MNLARLPTSTLLVRRLAAGETDARALFAQRYRDPLLAFAQIRGLPSDDLEAAVHDTLRLAAELGCEYMEVNSGWGYWNEDKEEAWKRSADMLHRLAEVAKENNVTLVMESIRPEESQLVIDLPAAQKMLREVGHPNLKAMVDTCAMGVAGETLEDWFRALGPDIRHMHFIDGTPYGHLVWGDGSHHLGRFIETLNRCGYEGYLGQEITDGRYFMDHESK